MQPATNVSPEQLRQHCLWCVRVAAVHFVGFQSCFGIREDVLLIQAHPGATTLAIPLSEVSPVSIAYKVLKSQERAA
jgi:hypothetical protein